MPKSPLCKSFWCTDNIPACGHCVAQEPQSPSSPSAAFQQSVTVYDWGEDKDYLVLWPDGELSICLPVNLKTLLVDNGLMMNNATFVKCNPIVGGGPNAPPPPPPPSVPLQTTQLVDPNDKDAQHYYTHLWTILGTVEDRVRDITHSKNPKPKFSQSCP